MTRGATAAQPRSRRLLTPILVAALAVGVAACGTIGSTKTTAPGGSPIVVGGSPLLDKPAPAIELKNLAGETVSLASYAGRPVVVNFWASWCVPCREEFPVFVAAREEHADAGLEILGVVYKDNVENAQRFADDQGATWPLLQDPGEAVYKAYTGFGGVPMTVFIDGGGVVRAVSYGPLSEAGFKDQVSLILPASSGSPAASSVPAGSPIASAAG